MASKFQGILQKAKEREPEPAEEVPPPSPAPTPELVVETRPKPQAVATPVKRGRPTGKRSDGEHTQVTAYIRTETHKAVKLALLQADKGKEFSELVQELLTKWLKSRT